MGTFFDAPFYFLNHENQKKSFAVFLSASVLFFSCNPKDSDVQAKITEKFAATPELAGASASVAEGIVALTGEKGYWAM